MSLLAQGWEGEGEGEGAAANTRCMWWTCFCLVFAGHRTVGSLLPTCVLGDFRQSKGTKVKKGAEG